MTTTASIPQLFDHCRKENPQDLAKSEYGRKNKKTASSFTCKKETNELLIKNW